MIGTLCESIVARQYLWPVTLITRNARPLARTSSFTVFPLSWTPATSPLAGWNVSALTNATTPSGGWLSTAGASSSFE